MTLEEAIEALREYHAKGGDCNRLVQLSGRVLAAYDAERAEVKPEAQAHTRGSWDRSVVCSQCEGIGCDNCEPLDPKAPPP